MKHYYDYLKKNKYNIQYINFNKTPTYKKAKLFDTIDKIKIPNTTLIESPNFLLTKENYDAYKKKKGDSGIPIKRKTKTKTKTNRKRKTNSGGPLLGGKKKSGGRLF